jgi:hypothetical protein
MGTIRVKIIILSTLILMACSEQKEEQGFKHRGFYLHSGWFFNYPFSVRTWQQEDFSNMFRLLERMGYDQVGIWPMLEAIPRPLSPEDSLGLVRYRAVIDDARSVPLECWIMMCPNLDPDPGLAALPWPERNPYPAWTNVRLDDPQQAEPFLKHRTKILSILNNADAYVTIDGDPGGYEGALPADLLKVFVSDRAAIDRYGTDPSAQRLIAWIWCGWGTKQVWGGNPNNPPEEIIPYTQATMELFRAAMPEPWEMLPGRSHRENWANGRVNIALADTLGIMDRSTIFCYEAIEFEPTPPATILQFDHIRRILNEELQYSGVARGVFGNAQQPVMVLPNLYFFARASADPGYMAKPDQEILEDFARFLGGPSELLVPAWNCYQLSLEQLPADLPRKLRSVVLSGEPAGFIPGGPGRYLEILAKQAESRIDFLAATANTPQSPEDAAKALASAVSSLVQWWEVHRYVMSSDSGEPFSWRFVHDSQVAQLREWCHDNISDPETSIPMAAKILAGRDVLSEEMASHRLRDLVSN